MARERRTTVLTIGDVEDVGTDKAAELALELATKGASPVFLSLDIDVVDPRFAPGTASPEPGGLTPREMLRFIRTIAREAPLCGMEVVEVAPPYDSGEITSLLACRAILDVLGTLVTEGKLGRRDAVRLHLNTKSPRTYGERQRTIISAVRVRARCVSLRWEGERDERHDDSAVHGDADKLEAFAKDKHDLLMSISEKAKQHGVLSHRFYASDNELMVVDEWPSEEAFQAFFDASPEISSVMQDSGATSRPTITFWRKLETGDEV